MCESARVSTDQLSPKQAGVDEIQFPVVDSDGETPVIVVSVVVAEDRSCKHRCSCADRPDYPCGRIRAFDRRRGSRCSQGRFRQ